MPSRLGAAWWLWHSEDHEVSLTMISVATVVGERSLWGISYRCPRTRASRIERHDKIIDFVESGASRQGYDIKREPAILTLAGIRKPDLILDRGECVTILDVTIVADNSDLEECHEIKCLCYGPRSISFEAVAMNWRGLLAVRSAAAPRALGLSASFLSLILCDS